MCQCVSEKKKKKKKSNSSKKKRKRETLRDDLATERVADAMVVYQAELQQ